MTATDWLAAFGLMLVIEGLLPFAAPAAWREAFRRVIELHDGQIRFVGAAALAAGVLLLTMLGSS
ncbi:MAG: DUF2065 domain-containing protein [Gammaproteobacteria bacterium]